MIKLKYKFLDAQKLPATITNHIQPYWLVSEKDLMTYRVLVVYSGDAWAGYACIRTHTKDANFCYLGPTFVKPEFRGFGLQTYLIKRRIIEARKRGYIRAVSSTFWDNLPSNNNLIRCGFHLIESWHPEPEPRTLYWEKDI